MGQRNCYICKKELADEDWGEWVIIDNKDVCLKHHGVAKEWMYEATREFLEDQNGT